MIDYINVDTNEIKVTTEKNSFIGTNSLGPCVGLLLYSEKYKIAGFLHKSPDGSVDNIKYMFDELYKSIVYEIFNRYNDYDESIFKYAIIPNAIDSDKSNLIVDTFQSLLIIYEDSFIPFSEEEFSFKDYYTVKYGKGKDEYANEFAFDANKGIFVTDIVFSNDKSKDAKLL